MAVVDRNGEIDILTCNVSSFFFNLNGEHLKYLLVEIKSIDLSVYVDYRYLIACQLPPTILVHMVHSSCLRAVADPEWVQGVGTPFY